MFTPFKARIEKWDEKRVLLEIEVRKLKTDYVQPNEKKSVVARFRRELGLLASRLADLRTAELFPKPEIAPEHCVVESHVAERSSDDPARVE